MKIKSLIPFAIYLVVGGLTFATIKWFELFGNTNSVDIQVIIFYTIWFICGYTSATRPRDALTGVIPSVITIAIIVTSITQPTNWLYVVFSVIYGSIIGLFTGNIAKKLSV
ncbi:hypothetical protein A2572_03625 [Candidatus Collierbacteria bacterium RIFOXYD1_FULL_40_9]|uniref:Uncharacterized protein n=1 Tax=Candidatus Collierbacteria bacterium RIFOXYD1_FULL_40_9 TaxID=1817731 RepID=A0A1F5FTQ7_9BACT|nr:MAG: hypothetical protein A2572_03625 [Candidatus Collierbacteria bacterium RIFOXYD1_FULL_40_9]